MKEEKEARRAALNIEEAAMLPALPARRMDGGAALKFARQRAEAMRGMTLTAEKAWGTANDASKNGAAPTVRTRAALNHALGRRAAKAGNGPAVPRRGS